MATISPDHKCIYRNEPVSRALDAPLWPVAGDPVLFLGETHEVCHICSIVHHTERWSKALEEYVHSWQIIDCQGRQYTVSHHQTLDGWNCQGWAMLRSKYATDDSCFDFLDIERASVRQRVKGGWILVWKNLAGTYACVVSWQIYPNKNLAEAAKTREILKTMRAE